MVHEQGSFNQEVRARLNSYRTSATEEPPSFTSAHQSAAPANISTADPAASPSGLSSTEEPVVDLSASPSGAPTGIPTAAPTISPSGYTSLTPTEYPTGKPTSTLTGKPINTPTGSPSGSPTGNPTEFPQVSPLLKNNYDNTINNNITMPTVGLCAIISDNAKAYVKEWIDYNLLAIEFDDVYLYDNSVKYNATFWNPIKYRHNVQEGQKQRLHVFHFPEPHYTKQMLAYNQCVERFQNRSDYLAFLDDDEFLVLNKHPNVASLLLEHCPTGSLSIQWHVYGTSNHSKYTPGTPVTKRFQWREPQMDARVKSIVRVRDFVGFKSPHSVETRPGTTQKLLDGTTRLSELGATTAVTNCSYLDRSCEDIAVLNHYKYKSEEEYMLKSCVRQSVTNIDKGCGDTHLPAGTVFDDTAWQLLQSKVPKYAKFNRDNDEVLPDTAAAVDDDVEPLRALNFIHVSRPTAILPASRRPLIWLVISLFKFLSPLFRFRKLEARQSFPHPLQPISRGQIVCSRERTKSFNAQHPTIRHSTTATPTAGAVIIILWIIFQCLVNVQIRMQDKIFLRLYATRTIE